MAHILVVVAKRYNGHELWTTLGVLQKRGHTFDVVSSALHIEDEVTGQRNVIKHTFETLRTFNHDGLVFVSGNMADTESHWKNPTCLSYVEDAYVKNVPVAAICCSTPMVRSISKGKRVSFFPLIRIREMFTEAGAVLSRTSLSTDGKLITAENQMMTEMWATNFCDVLENKPVSFELKESAFKMPVRQRRPIAEVEALKRIVQNTGKSSFKETK